MSTVNLKMERHTMFTRRGEVANIRGNWQSRFEVKRSSSRSLEKNGWKHITSAIGSAHTCCVNDAQNDCVTKIFMHTDGRCKLEGVSNYSLIGVFLDYPESVSLTKSTL